MKALVSKWEIKQWTEQYPNFLDCPPYIEVEVLPVIAEEAAKRLTNALNPREQRKATAKPKRKTKSSKGS
jgi:hypothetical protein